MNKPISEKISELRKARSLTQEKLGEQLGVTSQAVSRWEKGETMPDIMLLPQLCQILGISIDALLEMPLEVKKDNLMKDLADYAQAEDDKCKVICEAFQACLTGHKKDITGSALISSKGINVFDKSGIGFVLGNENIVASIHNTDETRIKYVCEILSDERVIAIIKALDFNESYSETELAERANLSSDDIERALFKLGKLNFCHRNDDEKYSFNTTSQALFAIFTGIFLTSKEYPIRNETRNINLYTKSTYRIEDDDPVTTHEHVEIIRD